MAYTLSAADYTERSLLYENILPPGNHEVSTMVTLNTPMEGVMQLYVCMHALGFKYLLLTV